MLEAPVKPPVLGPLDLDALSSARTTALRRALSASPYDALLLTTAEGVCYATGYRSVSADLFGSHRMAALLTADDCWLVVPAADTAPAADTGFPVDRIVPFGRFFFEASNGSPLADASDVHPDFLSAVHAAVAAAGGIHRVGVEGLSADLSLKSVAWLVEDSTDLITRVRAKKLPGEVALLRYSAQLAEAGVAAAVSAAEAGVTERELAQTVAATMVAGGADPRFVVVTTGERSALADARPSDRAWKAGELARFDVGCVVQGYWSDIGRTAVLGEPTETQASRYDAILAAQEEQFRLVRPGVTPDDLFGVAMRTVEGHGLRYRRHHCGHGIGLTVYEPPVVSPGVVTPLKEGMTLCLETPYYELGWGGMMVEDTIVVTAGGMERLTSSDRGLWVVQR